MSDEIIELVNERTYDVRFHNKEDFNKVLKSTESFNINDIEYCGKNIMFSSISERNKFVEFLSKNQIMGYELHQENSSKRL